MGRNAGMRVFVFFSQNVKLLKGTSFELSLAFGEGILEVNDLDLNLTPSKRPLAGLLPTLRVLVSFTLQLTNVELIILLPNME